MKVVAALAAALFGLTIEIAAAEEVTPTLSRYVFSKQPGSATDECGVTLLVSNYPSPEYASARLEAIQGTGGAFTAKSTWGLGISVSDATYVNGIATKYTAVPLSHGTFTGFNFSSDGRLGSSQQPDGSVFLFGPDNTTVSAMITAFQMGDETISFTREGTTMIRSYRVKEHPPFAVMQQFIACTQRLFGPK